MAHYRLLVQSYGVDNVSTIDSADDFAEVDQHTRPRNAARDATDNGNPESQTESAGVV